MSSMLSVALCIIYKRVIWKLKFPVNEMPSFSFVKCHSYTTIKDVAHSTEMGNINALNMHYISKLPRSSYLRAITQPWKFCASAVPSFLSTLYVSDMLEQGWLCGCGVELNCSASSVIHIISIESG